MMSMRFSNEEFALLKKSLITYEWAQRTLLTKLSIIQESLADTHATSPIEYIHARLKAPESIAKKLHRLGHDITAANAKEHLRDIAGVRIICPFARDIYFLVEMLRSLPNTNILIEKDYISKPKPSGYRSYHVILEVPIFHHGQTEYVPVEVQIRTEAMNFWSTLEHNARYKYQEDIPQNLCDDLVTCANKIAELDNQMFLIHETIHANDPRNKNNPTR